MVCRINDCKISLWVINVVIVPENHCDNERTEPYYGVVACLIHDEQARIKWSIFYQYFKNWDNKVMFWFLDLNITILVLFSYRSRFLNLRQFLANGSPLEMMKNASYFTLKYLFVLKIFEYLSWIFR